MFFFDTGDLSQVVRRNQNWLRYISYMESSQGQESSLKGDSLKYVNLCSCKFRVHNEINTFYNRHKIFRKIDSPESKKKVS